MPSASPDVTRHLAAIEAARVRVGLTPSQIGLPTVLALIAVESAGDPEARKTHVYSEFWGLLQMGRMAGIDVGLEDRGVDTADVVHGDPDRALELFMRYQDRYEARHDWTPHKMAVVWKGGPGTARTYNEALADGMSRAAALKHAEDEHSIHNLREYLRRFRGQLHVYVRWVDDVANAGKLMCKMPGREEPTS